MPTITRLNYSEILWPFTTIIISGWGFNGATSVYFRSQNLEKFSAKSYTVDSDTQITAVTPPVPNNGVYHVYVMVNDERSTTPLVQTAVSDGDSMRGTATGGITLIDVPSDANRLRMTAGSEPEYRPSQEQKDLHAQLHADIMEQLRRDSEEAGFSG